MDDQAFLALIRNIASDEVALALAQSKYGVTRLVDVPRGVRVEFYNALYALTSAGLPVDRKALARRQEEVRRAERDLPGDPTSRMLKNLWD
jgi:hypothetical protein